VQVYIQLILYPLAIVFVLPFVISTHTISRVVPVDYHFQWEVGTVVIFLAWFNLLLYMQRSVQVLFFTTNILSEF
jgi:hypothetical protein